MHIQQEAPRSSGGVCTTGGMGAERFRLEEEVSALARDAEGRRERSAPLIHTKIL